MKNNNLQQIKVILKTYGCQMDTKRTDSSKYR